MAKRAQHGVLTLMMPADSIPSLNALVSRNLDIPPANRCALGSFVFVEVTTGDPKWVVTVPPVKDELLQMQPAATAIAYPILTRISEDNDTDKSVNCTKFPVALRFGDTHGANEAQLLMPSTPDVQGPILRVDQQPPTREKRRISVILPSHTDASKFLPALLESLRLQTAAEALEIVANVNDYEERLHLEKLLRVHFPGRFRTRWRCRQRKRRRWS